MSVSFATPIAHQTGSNYTAFNNAIALGRPYRQPLQTAPNPNNFAPGLELFLSSAGDVAVIYSWLDSSLSWLAASGAQPANRLALNTDSRILIGKASLSGLNIVESLPDQVIYENVDQTSVQTALETLLNSAYTAAVADPKHPKHWHPAMRMQVLSGGTNTSLKDYIDHHTPATTTITQLVTDFLTGAAGVVVRSLPVRAGDAIGRAAPYLVTDTLPPAPPFPLGGSGDANRARRLTFQTLDRCQQPINPIYYLHIFMRRMLLPSAGRIVESLTNIISGGTLTHPLVTLFPSLSNPDLPAAREQVNGPQRFVLGDLNTFHGYPTDAPVSSLEWRYTDASIFEAQAHVVGTTVPSLTPVAVQTNRVTNLWTLHGAAIAAICEALQIPCEVVFGLIGAEAPADPGNINRFDERAVRLEPLKLSNRTALSAGGVSAAIQLQYDKAVGIQGNVTTVVLNANGTTRLDITLVANRKYPANFLVRSYFFMLVADADRLPITANNSMGAATTNYQITVRDFQFSGGFAANGTQASDTTQYYSISTSASGNDGETSVRVTLGRAGTLRQLRLSAEQNTLNGATMVTVYHNGSATGITVTLASGHNSGNDMANTLVVASGDTISLEVVTAGTTGNIKNLTWTLLNAPTTGDAWILEGFSTRVPDPWVGATAVHAPSSTLTWNQLVDVVDATNGERISPGIIQTLISTARSVLPFLNGLQPNIYNTLKILPPPANAVGFLNDWLAHAPHSILVGAAYIRQAYNTQITRFDLPVVGSAYNNSGAPITDATSPWGLHYFDKKYVERAGPVSNAAATYFNSNLALNPRPTVRFML